MSLGKVEVYEENLRNGEPTQVENIALFVGQKNGGTTSPVFVSSSTDLSVFSTNRDRIIVGDANDLDTKVGLPIQGHGFLVGENITITGTTNYDGNYSVETESTRDEVVISATYISESFTDAVIVYTQEDEDVLYETLKAAQLQNTNDWYAFVVQRSCEDTLEDIIDDARKKCSFEFIVNCEEVESYSDAEALQLVALDLNAKMQRKVFCIGSVAGIDAESQTWSDYTTSMQDLIDGFKGNGMRVMLVPRLWGNELGCLAGRLTLATIGDSPIRTLTGAVVTPGEKPVDSLGKEIDEDIQATLDSYGYTVMQEYEDYDGVYFADGNTFDTSDGDFAKIERLRPVDAVARRVRSLAIKKIGDRKLNTSEVSIDSHKTYFAKPLRDLSKSYYENNILVPAVLKRPMPGDVEIFWESSSKVKIMVKCRLYEYAKEISIPISIQKT